MRWRILDSWRMVTINDPFWCELSGMLQPVVVVRVSFLLFLSLFWWFFCLFLCLFSCLFVRRFIAFELSLCWIFSIEVRHSHLFIKHFAAHTGFLFHLFLNGRWLKKKKRNDGWAARPHYVQSSRIEYTAKAALHFSGNFVSKWTQNVLPMWLKYRAKNFHRKYAGCESTAQ